MEEIKKLLEERKKYLYQLKKEKEEALERAPEGRLRICCHGNKVQYYHRNNPKDFNGVYIRGKDVDIARRLAQKDYDERILEAVEAELKIIDNFYSNYPKVNAEQIYDNLRKTRQELIVPILEPIDTYVQKWETKEYEGKIWTEGIAGYDTAKGETVRSKSELIIADSLYRSNIPYRYECPIYLKGRGHFYPDFTVLNVRLRKEIYWEHLGMMDNPEYVENAIQKIAVYEQNGIFPGENLILTYETKKNPINQKTVKLMIQHYLQ